MGAASDMEVGLSYHGARYYSPALHRWMSPDPVTIHSAGSDFNPYSYGYGNPTSYVDPDGREPFTIIAIIVVAAVVSATTSATVQYATTGHIDWGLKGVAGAAIAGAVGAATGIGVGAMAAGWGIGAGAVGGAAGGAMGGATGTALGGGSLSAIGSSALTGAISGAVGGAVGVWAGSTSSDAATAFGGTMAGTGAGTSAGIGWGALTGDAPTWQSAGIAFGAAFGGAIASTALSSGVQAATAGSAAGEAAYKGSHSMDAARGTASGSAAHEASLTARAALAVAPQGPAHDPLDLFASPPPEPSAGPRAVRAWAEGSNTVIEYEGGAQEVRGGRGSMAWRNNNPGNLRGSPYQIGRANGFAVFGSEAEGEAALRSLLSNEPYAGMSIDRAIGRYAPAFENDTTSYQAAVRGGIGISGSALINQLTETQFGALVNTIRGVEQWRPGTVTWR